MRVGSEKLSQFGFSDAEAAARAYDAAMRKRGIKIVNFPNAAAGELQAVAGETNFITLRRPLRQRRRACSSAAHCAHAGACASCCFAAQAQPLALACWRAARRVWTQARARRRPRCGPRGACGTQQRRAAAREPGGVSAQHRAAALTGAPLASLRACSLRCALTHAALLRALTQVDAVLAAAAESGLTLAHLQAAANTDASLRSMYIGIALEGLRITLPGDKLAFMAAVDALWRQLADGA